MRSVRGLEPEIQFCMLILNGDTIMKMSLLQCASSTGCFAARGESSVLQYEAQIFTPNAVRQFELRREAIVKDVLLSEKLDRALRARIECFLVRELTPSQWAQVIDAGVDSIVDRYYQVTRQRATAIACGSRTFKDLYKELDSVVFKNP